MAKVVKKKKSNEPKPLKEFDGVENGMVLRDDSNKFFKFTKETPEFIGQYVETVESSGKFDRENFKFITPDEQEFLLPSYHAIKETLFNTLIDGEPVAELDIWLKMVADFDNAKVDVKGKVQYLPFKISVVEVE